MPGNTELRYSVVNLPGKCLYLQCVLRLQSLFASGLTELPSNEPISFYKCLLSGRIVPKGLGDKEYRRQLGNLPFLAIEGLDADPLPVEDCEHVNSDASSSSSAIMEGSGMAAIEGGGGGEVGGGHLDAPAGAIEDGSDSESMMLEGECDEGVADLPKYVGGARIRFDKFYDQYSRYIITCTHHWGCEKKRGCGIEQTKNFGPWEPIAYLAVWERHGSHTSVERHNPDVKPSLEEIREWLVANGKC